MGKFEEFQMPVKPTKEQQAARMREAFPQSAESIDFMRSLFGDDLVVLAVEEGGKSHKTKSYKADSEYRAVITGDDYLRLGKISSQANDIAEGKSGHAKRK